MSARHPHLIFAFSLFVSACGDGGSGQVAGMGGAAPAAGGAAGGTEPIDAVVDGAAGGEDAGSNGPPGPVGGGDANGLGDAEVIPRWDPTKYPWPMFGHDPRRTGRSPFVGPRTYTAGAPRNWSYLATAQTAINMQPAVSGSGVYFGGWGLKRQVPGAAVHDWIKFDGAWLGLHLASQGVAGQQLFAPTNPHPVGGCYHRAARAKTTPDEKGCGANNEYHLSRSSGSIDATPAMDPETGVMYVGRGDGVLYAVDPQTGQALWNFASFNPEQPDDPEGGGGIPGGPLVGPDRTIYFATSGSPWPEYLPDEPAYQTHAIYAVDGAGKLLWRYPANAARLDNGVLAAPALSADGRTLYVGTWNFAGAAAGRLFALDTTAASTSNDGGRLKWSLELKHPTRAGSPAAWVRHLSVGLDGIVYLGGRQAGGLGAPMVAAIRDGGTRGEVVWWVEPQGYPSTTAQFVQGLALWEEGGMTARILASTGHRRDTNGTGGALLWLDARTGEILATFDPAMLPKPGVGGMSPPILGNDGTAYVGIRGRHDFLFPPDVASSQWRNGHMYGVRLDPRNVPTVVLDVEVDGIIDSAAPAIGANGALYFGSSAKFRDLVELQRPYAPGAVPDWTSPAFNAVFE
jgi:outer membrane protein assembly factor BamB